MRQHKRALGPVWRRKYNDARSEADMPNACEETQEQNPRADRGKHQSRVRNPVDDMIQRLAMV